MIREHLKKRALGHGIACASCLRMRARFKQTRGVIRIFVLTGLLSAAAWGQSTSQPPSDESLSSKVVSPIAFLPRVTLENKHSPSLWDSAGEENQVEGEFVIPFEGFSRPNLARVKVIFETSKPDGTHGLTESEIFYLTLSVRSWGDLGAGITTHLTSQTSRQLGTIAPGPAVGVVVRHGKWKYGFFSQSFLSDTFAETELQPILAYAFNARWSAEIGDAQYTYNWKTNRVTLLPLSGQLNRIMWISGQSVHLFFRSQYNLKNASGSDKWTLVAGVSIVSNKK
jgi:hypothetical protein